MKRIYHKSKNFEEAESWDIDQHVQMTPEERQEAAKELRKRVYGQKPPEIKQTSAEK